MAAFGTISEDLVNLQEGRILTLVNSLDNIDKDLVNNYVTKIKELRSKHLPDIESEE
jgi:RNA processing factor Prp31